MLKALLHGKLSREQENMEDIVTSNVFGTVQYLANSSDLIQFLSKAALLNRETGQEGLPLGDLPSNAHIEFEFWPWLNDHVCAGCEPDVLLRVDSGGDRRYLILIEVKYHSGKSSEASETTEQTNSGDATKKAEDQLAKEWQQLQVLAKN
jgi:hypothetical protein